MASDGIAGTIGHTQPRRIAAVSVSDFIAEQMGKKIPDTIGYKMRFEDLTDLSTRIKIMTDGILLQEIKADYYLSRYNLIMVDEAHERSLNIDFILGYLKQLLPKRPDLKVIVTSATIDTERFAEHFGEAGVPAPVFIVEGRTYPVEIRYRLRCHVCIDTAIGALQAELLVSLAILAFALAELLGGNGFIAAFTAGLTLGNTSRAICTCLYDTQTWKCATKNLFNWF